MKGKKWHNNVNCDIQFSALVLFLFRLLAAYAMGLKIQCQRNYLGNGLRLVLVHGGVDELVDVLSALSRLQGR
jgi:hypothetical protein